MKTIKSKLQFITWNNFDVESIKNAQRKKLELENKGFTLVHSDNNCLTYKLS